jgi:hypothetical protein
MVSNQVLGARVTTGLLIAAVALSACSHSPSKEQSAASTPAAAQSMSSAQASAAPAESDMTATEAAIAAGNAGGAAPSTSAAPVTKDMLNPSAPMHYTVKRGDTLWGISNMFLKDPWLWPEVWVINPQVVNPHLIYPGDTLALAYGADGHVHVTLEQAGALHLNPRLRTTPLDGAIPKIPYSTIAAFLSRPAVMTSDEVKRAPYVVGFNDMHQVVGNNTAVYVRNLSSEQNTANARYAIVHIADELRDPDDNRVLGYEAIYTGTALLQKAGDPATAYIIDPARETLRGDRLAPSDKSELPANFTPQAPNSKVHGQIINVVSGADLVGPWQVVVMNRGSSQGLAPGNVLAINHVGDVVPDLFRNGRSIANGNTGNVSFAPKVKLPDERVGTVLVFKVYDRVSYGLVIGASDAIRIYDVVLNP